MHRPVYRSRQAAACGHELALERRRGARRGRRGIACRDGSAAHRYRNRAHLHSFAPAIRGVARQPRAGLERRPRQAGAPFHQRSDLRQRFAHSVDGSAASFTFFRSASVDHAINPTITSYGWVPEFARGFVRDLRPRWAFEEVGQRYDVNLITNSKTPRTSPLPAVRTGADVSRRRGCDFLVGRDRAAHCRTRRQADPGGARRAHASAAMAGGGTEFCRALRHGTRDE